MLKRYKRLFILLILFLVIAPAVLALEVEYPYIPGIGGGPGASFNLNTFIQYVFVYLILSAGAIGIIAIVISGFQILMSFGSPAARGAANERIRNALLGIMLLMSSVIILRTINPVFINPHTTFAGLPPGTGIYLREPAPLDENHPDKFAYREAAASSEDTSKEPVDTEIYFKCKPGTSRRLLVWLYEKPSFYRSLNDRTVALDCDEGEQITAPVASYQTAIEEPGVYFYESTDCSGFSSSVHKSPGTINYYSYPNPGQIKSVRILSGLKPDERYGVILGKNGGGITQGECSEPMLNPDPGVEICFGDGGTQPLVKDLSGNFFKPLYAYIIKHNPRWTSTPDSEGLVQIYSQNLFARLNQQTSVLVGPSGTDYTIRDKYIYNLSPADGNPDNLIREQYIWDNMVYTDGYYEDECCTKEDSDLDCNAPDPNGTCLQGIEINGTYYVFLYSRNDKSGERMCQDFFSDWDDIPNQTSLLAKNKKLYKLVIIPRY